jgi:uncharacterized protein YndB with AHSA1/START domain
LLSPGQRQAFDFCGQKIMFTKVIGIATSMLCASHLLAQTAVPNAEKINWPPKYEPSKSKFFVHNEIEVNAPAEIVWDILLRAEEWPKWYKGAKNVALSPPADSVLQADAVFRWKTMGLDFESTIREFAPPFRLSWESKKRSIQGYHAWLIVPTERGCRVVTDESQRGWLTFFEKTFQPRKLRRLHDVWLAEIKKKAEAQAQLP